ncbi:MAG: hypothetical protein K5756_05495 [Clostridiales bacterium]|nr:hypothetical protein [Clostridiales bacterium]
MKGILKRTLSMVLCLVMLFTVFQGAIINTSAKVVGPDKKTQLTISTDKKKYAWGDTIVFSIDVKNVANEELKNIEISSFAKSFYNIAWQGDVPFIESLKPGETKTVQISYFTFKTVGPWAIFWPFIMLNHPGTRSSYKKTSFNYEKMVRVGLGLYRVGFKVEYNKTVVEKISDYKPGDYTAAYKNFFAGNSYTFAADIGPDAIEGLELKDTRAIVYVSGISKTTHYTFDLRKVLANADKHRILGYYSISKSPFLKHLYDAQAYIIKKTNKFYLSIPQLCIYTKAYENSDYEKINDLIGVVFKDGEFIGSETVDGMIRESFKIDNDLIYHYYYKDGVFVSLDAEKNGKISNVLVVKSISEGVKNKSVFNGPYGFEV